MHLSLDVIKKSFISESRRSGMYGVSSSRNDSCYHLSIDIMKYDVRLAYYEEGKTVLWDQDINCGVSPSYGYLQLHAKLFNRNGQLIFEKRYTEDSMSSYFKEFAWSRDEINQAVMQNMSETLSQCVKEDIAEIVADINKVVQKKI